MAGLFDASRLYEALAEQGLLPQRSVIPSGYYDPDANRMTGQTKTTQAHEMTHAVQWNLLMNSAKTIQEKKWEGQSVTPQEEQFLDAMQKMYGDSFGRVGQRTAQTKQNASLSQKTKESQLKSMYQPSDKDYDSYRTSRRELEAHGVGEMVSPDKVYRDKPHLNPTMAQEFDILFSMYNTLPKSVKAGAAARRKENLEFAKQKGYRDTKLDVLDFEDFKADPFKPTIK